MKYQLIDMDNESVIAKGNCERIGNGGMIGHKLADGTKIEYEVPFPTHAEAFAEVLKLLTTGEHKVVNDMSEIAAVGHRTVHGGEKFASSVLITEDVLKAIDELSTLAPLHNPPGLAAIRASKKVFGEKTPMVAVFDTAFHQTMPSKAYMYGIPYEYYEKYGVRRYGFHGTSHRFVSGRLAELAGKKDLKVVTCHLGNGSSISAVVNGQVVDTSLGMTTNAGIIMGTRSGDVDPGIPALIAEKAGVDFAGATNILQKKSGLEGVSGVSSDMRDIENAIEQGNERAKLAWDMLVYQIKKATLRPWAAATRSFSPAASARTMTRFARRSARVWNSWALSLTPRRTRAAAKRPAFPPPIPRCRFGLSRLTRSCSSPATPRKSSLSCKTNIRSIKPGKGHALSRFFAFHLYLSRCRQPR